MAVSFRETGNGWSENETGGGFASAAGSFHATARKPENRPIAVPFHAAKHSRKAAQITA
jgi:hypothetical protein